MKRVVALMTGLMLLIALAAFAQAGKTKAPQAPKPKPPVTKTATGTISTVSSTALVITHKVKGKDEQTTFVLNAQTKTTGDPAVGATASVHYTVANNQNIATAVTVTPAKAAKPPAPKPVTTKKK
jgi:hypothetical protein